ncbi:MAG: sulfatase-like hydrolase/transferase [Bacteroidetes bacterium]|nr:sulfatase-like hydrolase/transferase [Bacteroidota bacterium]
MSSRAGALGTSFWRKPSFPHSLIPSFLLSYFPPLLLSSSSRIRHVRPLQTATLLVLLLTRLTCDADVTGAESEVPENARPSILVIYTDDQRYNTLHSLGNNEIATPNLDRLVREGTSFTRAHIMGGMHGALCAPSRAMLMTGRSLFDLQDSGDIIPEGHIMMPTQFAASGYATFGTGKWHNDRPAFNRAFQFGENIFFGGMLWPQNGGQEHPWIHHYDPTGAYPDSTKEQSDIFSSTLFTNAAVDFIRSRKESDAPFFAYVAYTSPHDPRTPPEPFKSSYVADSISLPANYLPEHPFDNGELKVRDEMLAPHPRTEAIVKSELAAYYGMISEVDAQIGRLIDALEETGVRENTIVVYAGDNGLAVGSHGLMGKQNLYDHSMRIPMVISGPGINRGEQRDALVYQYDVFPTLAELVGISVPATVDGQSLVPVLRRPDATVRDAVFYAYKDLQRGVRTADDWKIIRYNVDGVDTVQLFNLADDPNETVNLAGDPDYADRLAQMDSLLLVQSKLNHDRIDLSLPNWGK